MKPQEIILKTLALTVFTSVMLIVVVTILGVGISNNSFVICQQFPGVDTPVISDPSILGKENAEESYLKNKDVLVADLAADYCIDTEAGFMVINYDIPDVLPLCITEDYLDSNFAITTMTYGGYHADGMSFMAINQPKTGLGGLVGIEWIYVGSFICDDPAMVCFECEVDLYTADFVLPEPIQVDSNNLPAVFSYGADWSTMIDDPVSDNLNKWVYLAILSNWEGCDQGDQKFQLILAHLYYFLEFPTSIWTLYRQCDFSIENLGINPTLLTNENYFRALQ